MLLHCVVITKTCPCNIKRIFLSVTTDNFIKKILITLIYLLKTLIVGTRQNYLGEVVLTSTHNLEQK